MVQEVLTGESSLSSKLAIPCYVLTHCRSLYDAMSKAVPTLSEKRTLIDVLSIRETIGGIDTGSGALRWIPTTAQMAVALKNPDG